MTARERAERKLDEDEARRKTAKSLEDHYKRKREENEAPLWISDVIMKLLRKAKKKGYKIKESLLARILKEEKE